MTIGIDLTKYLTSADIAEALQCTTKHVNTLRKRGELRATAIGGMWRYDPADLKAYLKSQKGSDAA